MPETYLAVWVVTRFAMEESSQTLLTSVVLLVALTIGLAILLALLTFAMDQSWRRRRRMIRPRTAASRRHLDVAWRLAQRREALRPVTLRCEDALARAAALGRAAALARTLRCRRDATGE